MSAFKRDHDWQATKLGQVKAILGSVAFEDASSFADKREATDLILMQSVKSGLRVAVRLRAAEYGRRYPGEFTIRHSRTSGAKTELAKIESGYGDWLFYGFVEESGIISGYMVIDLDILRMAWFLRPNLLDRPDNKISGIKHNTDAATSLIWFNAHKLDKVFPDLIISEALPLSVDKSFLNSWLQAPTQCVLRSSDEGIRSSGT